MMSLPQFPEFAPVSLDHKNVVESFTERFDPYSDFNFTSLWSWNLTGQTALSEHNNNLIIKLADYITGLPRYVFLGDTHVTETANQLLDISSQDGGDQTLKLIPEVCIAGLDKEKFLIAEDRDNFDYIYSLSDLDTYPGRAYAKKRNHVSGFLRSFPTPTYRELSLHSSDDVVAMKSLFEKIEKNKREGGVTEELHDIPLLDRLLMGKDVLTLCVVGVFIDEILVAVMVNEVLPNGYSIGHLMGADLTISPGLYAYLIQINARVLLEHGCTRFNFEQDLGLENLRIAKTRFMPTSFLKKYTVTHSPEVHNT